MDCERQRMARRYMKHHLPGHVLLASESKEDGDEPCGWRQGMHFISRKQDATDCGSKCNFKDVGRHDEHQTIPGPLCVSHWKIVWIKII